MNFTIKENTRGERAKDETFQNAFSRTLLIMWLLVILRDCQEELFHLEQFQTPLFENYNSYDLEHFVMYS